VTDSAASQPAGWYHAQGDPPGTQRYWDGSQWVGGPQAAQDTSVQAGGGYGQPAYAVGGLPGVPASYGSRVIAVLIDGLIGFGIVIAGFLVAFVLGFASEALATILFIIGIAAGALVFPIWNTIVRQGQSGQTIGKSQQNIRLVADATGAPVGIGSAILRWLLGGLLISICYIDILWPLFDEQKKRITDKILDFSVIDA